MLRRINGFIALGGSVRAGGTPTPTIDPTPAPDGVYDVGYTNLRTVSGGSPPYTVAVTSGALPAGLEAWIYGDQLGISGIPTASGTSGFILTVTDANGQTALFVGGITVPSYPAALTVAFGDKTRARHGGHYLGNAAGGTLSITAGNGAGHWAIVDNRLVPAGTYGSTPPAYAGPYTLTVSNGTSDCIVTVNIEANTAHCAVGTATNADTASSFQLRTIVAGAILARGDTVKLRNGSYNPTQLDYRTRPAVSYSGTGKIIIRSEWADPAYYSWGAPKRGGGARWTQLKHDGAVSGDVDMPFRHLYNTFYSNTAGGLNAAVAMLGYATPGFGVEADGCRFEQGPDVLAANFAYGMAVRAGTSVPVDVSNNSFVNVKRMMVIGMSAGSGRATGQATWNDGYLIHEDGIDLLINETSGFILTDNLIPSWVYTLGAHQDGIQDQGSTAGAITGPVVRRNIIYNADPTVTVQGLWNDDTTAGNSRDDAVYENNIVIATASNGAVWTRFNRLTARHNTAIASLASGFAFDTQIRTTTGAGGTDGTFSRNASNFIDVSSQAGTVVNTLNLTVARTLGAYQAAFPNWSEAGTLLTREALKRIVTPLAGGPLMNGDGTYSGALLPDGSWNAGVAP